MNFLIDVHLPIGLSKYLNARQEVSAIHVNQILQKWNTPDPVICKYADDNGLTVITKDSDFKNSHFIKDTPQKVIRIALGNCTNADLIRLFEKYLPFIITVTDRSRYYIEIGWEQITIID